MFSFNLSTKRCCLENSTNSLIISQNYKFFDWFCWLISLFITAMDWLISCYRLFSSSLSFSGSTTLIFATKTTKPKAYICSSTFFKDTYSYIFSKWTSFVSSVDTVVDSYLNTFQIPRLTASIAFNSTTSIYTTFLKFPMICPFIYKFLPKTHLEQPISISFRPHD